MTNVVLTAALAAVLTVPAAAQDQAGDRNRNLPLRPDRLLEFTTSEGSWTSVDISPDGRTVVFDLLGDLYTVPITGGAATRITSGTGYDAQPRFSPDGNRIVFVSDRNGGENLWLLALADGDTTMLTSGRDREYMSPEWTPDGKYIIASRGGGTHKLWMYHVDGGSGIELFDEPANLKTIGAAFGPDDRYIWFAQRTNSWRYNAQFPQYQLAVYDRHTGERYSRSSRYGSAFRPTLSPDGRWLVYGTRHEEHTGLRLRDLRTGDEDWLAYPVQRDDQESPATSDVLPGMSFTPDSREVVASYGGGIWRIPIDGSAPIAVPYTAEVRLDIGPAVDFDYPIEDTPTFVAKQIRDVVPSPDGSRLAFVAMDRLWVMDYPQGEPRRVTDSNLGEHHPAWSPDGRWLVYATWGDDEGGHLYRVEATRRRAPQRLTPTPGYYTDPAWSPDGERIAAIRTAALNFQRALARGGASDGEELVWVPAAGGQVTPIGPAQGISTPHFTADPTRVYANRAGRLISLRWDGTDVREHVRVRGATVGGATQPLNASTLIMAPRGDQALVQIVNDLFVVTVPVVGGETPTISVANPDNATLPSRQLTTIGGQFPAWGADGTTVHWAVGNAHVRYDLVAAKAFEDSVEAAKGTADNAPQEIRTPEQAARDSARSDDEAKYEPAEIRVQIEVARDIPQGTAVLRGARIITMQGDEVIERGDILVENARITAVGPQGSVAVPDGARVIDVAGHTIIPGFVDTHAHLRPMYEIHKRHVWSYLANLAYGVTTTRDPQTATTDVLSYEDMVTAGEILGPRIYSTGPGVFSSERVRSQEHANDVLRRYADYYDTKTIKMYGAGNRQQRQWIINAARTHRLMPTTEGALAFKYNLINTIDGYPGMEHSLPVYPLYRDVVQLFAFTQRAYTPTLLVAYGGPWAENYYYATEEVHDDAKLRRFTPHEEIDQKSLRRGGAPGQAGWFRREQHVFDDHARFVSDLVAAGGRAGIGSHGQLQGLGYHWELWSMQSGGMTEHQALQVATRHGAEAIGLDGDVGTLEPGKLADLLVLTGNPLVNIRNTNTIRYVMKNGRLYDGDTLDEIWPRNRPLDPLPWNTDEPNTAGGVR